MQKGHFTSLPMLKSVTFPYALGLAFEAQKAEEGIEALLSGIVQFLVRALIKDFEWASNAIVKEDCCIAPAMLVSSFHHLDLQPDDLMTLLALLFSQEQRLDHLSIMMLKYKTPLLEMALGSRSPGGFLRALCKYVHDHEKDVFIDEWNPDLVKELTKKMMMTKEKSALVHMLLVSTVAKEVMLEEIQSLALLVECLDKPSPTKTSSDLTLLNNFGYRFPLGQRFLAVDLAVHRKLVSLVSKIYAQYVIAGQDSKRALMILICDFLTCLTTLVADCPEAKAALATNVNTDRGKSTCLLQLLVDLILNEAMGDNRVRSRIWIPNAFRIITASLTSVECRSWVIRSLKFLNGKCVRDLDQSASDPTLEVLWLDLLLSLTSFHDGQNWLAKSSEIVNVLVEKAKHQDSLPALAILRNLSFHPGGRAKLLLLPNYLSLLGQCLKKGAPGPVLRLALVSLWALAANCHKAKVALVSAGIPVLLEQLSVGESHEDDCLISQVAAVIVL